MIIEYVIILSIAHVLGDFYFQTENIATRKEGKFSGVLLHALEYLGVSLLVMVPIISFDLILAAFYLSFIHFMIDAVKYCLLQKKRNIKEGKIFVWDQIAHIVSILVLSYIMYNWNFEINHYNVVRDFFAIYGIDKLKLAQFGLILLILHTPTNILIQKTLSEYRPKEKNTDIIKNDSKAGRRIGTLERIIMLLFISMNQYAAMGLVLTAKSIARYDRIAKDEKFAEYYLLGTLLSTASVVVCKIVIL